ncbi:MAG: hypothetical protein JXL82_01900 [Candidatus Omnitrophica bacterium]|nr:hypothetical protein [Candidatus Omnitrophota bacterium]
MKVIEKEKALILRKQGKTFNEILEKVVVSKGSLSYWLRGIDLTDRQLKRIKYKNEKTKRKFVEYNAAKRKQAETEKEFILNSAAQEIGNLSKKELKLIGIALYWAEGYKASARSIAEFTNSDPAMITLMMRWFRDVCGVPEPRFRVRLQVHDIARQSKAVDYWSRVTALPKNQFTKPYVKISPSSKNKMGSILLYGICSLRVCDTKLFNKIQGWIKGLMALSSSPA